MKLCSAIYIYHFGSLRSRVIFMSHCIILGDWNDLKRSPAHGRSKRCGTTTPPLLSSSCDHCRITGQCRFAYFPSSVYHAFLWWLSVRRIQMQAKKTSRCYALASQARGFIAVGRPLSAGQKEECRWLQSHAQAGWPCLGWACERKGKIGSQHAKP